MLYRGHKAVEEIATASIAYVEPAGVLQEEERVLQWIREGSQHLTQPMRLSNLMALARFMARRYGRY
jgi:hypothetical protein